MPPCPQIPQGEEETTPISPTPTHEGLQHLFNTPPNPSNTINRFLLRCKKKDSSGGTTNKKKISTNTNLNWRPLWASKILYRKNCREVPHSLSSKQHHITSFCESWPTSIAFTFFSYSAGLMHKEAMSEKYHFFVFSGDFWCTEYSLEGKYFPNISRGSRQGKLRNAFMGPWARTVSLDKQSDTVLNLMHQSGRTSVKACQGIQKYCHCNDYVLIRS